MSLRIIQNKLKNSIIIILILNLIGVMMVTGSCATVSFVMLQDRTICISTGQRLTWGPQSSGMLTGYFIIFGRRVKRITDVTVCATSKIDGLGLASWHHQKLLTWLQHQETRDLAYYPRPVLTLKKCSPIKLYQYRPTIRSFSNQYRTEWKGRKPSYPTRFRQED